MNVKKFFETLGVLYAEKNDVKIKSIRIEPIKTNIEIKKEA